MSADIHSPSICIVGANHLHYELITFCLENELNARCAFYTDLASVDFSRVTSDRPQVLLYDCLDLSITDIENSFGPFAGVLPGHIHIAFFNVAPEVDLNRFVKQYKIHGIFFKDDSRYLFIKGLRTIVEGGLWLSRKMLSDCICMTVDTHNPLPLSLNKLSNREKAILKSVASGDSNQEIADQMGISVHTVKTHLYKIYRKIDVPNRMRATLWFNASLLKFSTGADSGNN